MNSQREMELPEEIAPGTWERLILATREYRAVAWLAFLITSLALFLI